MCAYVAPEATAGPVRARPVWSSTTIDPPLCSAADPMIEPKFATGMVQTITPASVVPVPEKNGAARPITSGPLPDSRTARDT